MGMSEVAHLFYGFFIYDEDTEGQHIDDEMYEKLESIKPEVVELNSAGHLEYPFNFICVKQSHIYSYRGRFETVKSLEIDPEWDTHLKNVCELLGIEFQQPAWYLAASYG